MSFTAWFFFGFNKNLKAVNEFTGVWFIRETKTINYLTEYGRRWILWQLNNYVIAFSLAIFFGENLKLPIKFV